MIMTEIMFLLEDKLDNSDCGLRLFKKGYNEMEHFWHYFDVIYVKQYFQEKQVQWNLEKCLNIAI